MCQRCTTSVLLQMQIWQVHKLEYRACSHLEVVNLPKDLACQAFTVDELAPLSQGWAASSNLICQPIQRSEDLHAAVVDEMSLHPRTAMMMMCACSFSSQVCLRKRAISRYAADMPAPADELMCILAAYEGSKHAGLAFRASVSIEATSVQHFICMVKKTFKALQSMKEGFAELSFRARKT